MTNIKSKSKVLFLYVIGTMLLTLNALASVTIYEDGTSLDTSKWSIYANDSGTATIANIYDDTHHSNVIEFSGDGLSDGFKIGDTRGASRWNNTQEKTLTWSMNYSEDVAIYIALKTTDGTRYLKYTNSDTDNGYHRGSIHHGLGSNITNGTWRTFTRDLEADLQEFDPSNTITAVNAFLIRGSGKVTDIALMSRSTLYEDAEDGLTTRWKTSTNATILNEFDTDKNSSVITLVGNGLEDTYTLGGQRGASRWNNKTERILSWSMNYSEKYAVIIPLSTTKGTRFLQYENKDIDLGLYRGKIHYGLGSDTIDGTWRTFTRDVEADLKNIEPSNSIIAVNAFIVRGSGKVDDIKLSLNIADKPTIVLNGDENIILNKGDSYIDAGATATDSTGTDITANIHTLNEVNTTLPGTYIITYDVKDSNNVWANQVKRTVIVRDSAVNNPPTATDIYIDGNVSEGSTVTLKYIFHDIDGDSEGNSTITWSTLQTELYSGSEHSFTIPSGYKGESICGFVRIRDEHGLEHEGQYDYRAENNCIVIQ